MVRDAVHAGDEQRMHIAWASPVIALDCGSSQLVVRQALGKNAGLGQPPMHVIGQPDAANTRLVARLGDVRTLGTRQPHESAGLQDGARPPSLGLAQQEIGIAPRAKPRLGIVGRGECGALEDDGMKLLGGERPEQLPQITPLDLVVQGRLTRQPHEAGSDRRIQLLEGTALEKRAIEKGRDTVLDGGVEQAVVNGGVRAAGAQQGCELAGAGGQGVGTHWGSVTPARRGRARAGPAGA